MSIIPSRITTRPEQQKRLLVIKEKQEEIQSIRMLESPHKSTVKATKIYQDALQQIEQCKILIPTIKENVLSNLREMYGIIISQNERIINLETQLLKIRGQHTNEFHCEEKKSKGKLPLESTKTEINEVTKEDLRELVTEIKNNNKQQEEKILLVVEDTKDKIFELNERMGEIKGAIEETKVSKSYANVVRNVPVLVTPEKTLTHSIIISSKLVEDTSGDVIEKIRSAVSASTTGIKVDRMRKARDRKVIMGCGSKKEIARISQRIKNIAPTLNVEEARNKDPLVIIKDIPTANTDEDILAALRNQNKQLLGDIAENEYRVVIQYKRNARNQDFNHVILRVSPEVWNRLTTAGRVYIDLQRVTVSDQSPLLQCTRCLIFGHGKRMCKETEYKCSHCGGKHTKNDCELWKKGTQPVCYNCVQAKIDSTDHNAFDYICTVRHKWDAIARSSVAYR